ncbi:hypothetical protein BS50DRAFT_475411, partial [Corynespora cassiicola Philippines]
IRIATSADLPAIARCWYDAFFDDEIIGNLMHPNRKKYPEDVYWFLLHGIRERYWDWRHQFIVAILSENGSEGVIGAADWRRVGVGGSKMDLAAWDPRSFVAPMIHLYHQWSLYLYPNRAADPGKSTFLDDATAKNHWVGEHKECWDLYVCGVHPDFQGCGIGQSLVNWGTDKADNEGVSCSVMCGEKNRGFYGKIGLVEEKIQGTHNQG